MFININDHRIHYTLEGSTTSPAIIILPGWGCDTTHYQKIQTHLAQKFQVYAIDLPGYGLTSAPTTPWSTEDYAKMLTAFIEKLAISNPILFGHSLGGKIAIYLTAKQLVPTKRLILVSSAGIKWPKTTTQLCKMYCYKLAKRIASLPLLKKILQAKLLAYSKKIASQDYLAASGIMRATLVKLVNEDFRHLLSHIHVPTLLLWGEKDLATPLKSGQLMQQSIQQAQLVTFTNAGHFPFLDNYSEFISAINEFLGLTP